MDGTGIKWSNFHVTVNFNVDGEAHIGAMRAAVDGLVESPYVWQWLRQYNGQEQVNFTRQTKHLVESVRLRAAFEHGGRQNHGLHVHIVIEIAHRTMVQISKIALVEYFRAAVGMNPSIHCRFVRGEGEDKDFILRYITKEVPTYAPVSKPNSRLQKAFRDGEVRDAESGRL